MKGRSASKIKLTSYDELLGGGEETNDIQQVSLEHLHSFENHPFQVNDDEAMAELVESVKEEGILTALLVRPLGDGEYEIIAGHRRRHAAQLAGLKEVPVIIRNMDQDTAVRAMVDSNLQRPNILPSEKAFAYRCEQLSAQPPLASVQLFTYPCRQKKHSPQKVSTFTVTLSPGLMEVTSAPTCSTMPTISCPTVVPGKARGTLPCLMCKSLVQMLPSVTRRPILTGFYSSSFRTIVICEVLFKMR